MNSSAWELIAGPLNQDDSPWELFHENSKSTRYDPFLPDAAAAGYTQQMVESLGFEAYPAVGLPEASAGVQGSLSDAIQHRPVVSELESGIVTLENVAALLRNSYGPIRNYPPGATRPPRAVHSAGSLFPLELFLHASRVAGLNSGVYHFNPPGDNLRFLRGGDQSQKLAPALMDGRLAQTAALIVFIAAMPERCVFRYGDRGYRFALLEAGAVLQNLNLIAGALGLACVNIGEYFDRQIDNILNLDGLTISILYMVAIGKPGGVEAAPSRGAGDGR